MRHAIIFADTADALITQGCNLDNGNHDGNDPLLTFFAKPITVGDGVWLTAFTRLGPGDLVPAGQVVGERAVIGSCD